MASCLLLLTRENQQGDFKVTGREYNNRFTQEELVNEIWKDIPDYGGYYQVSSLGRVRSLDRIVKKWNGEKISRGKLLIPRASINVKKRFMVSVYRQDIRKNYFVHRLVIETFLGSCPEGMECCHNDGDCENNRLENLRWDTPKNNQKDRIKHGTYQYGIKNPAAKLTEQQVREIRQRYATGNYSYSKVARMYGIHTVTAYDIVKRIIWKQLT